MGSLQRALEGSTDPAHRSSIEGELPLVKQALARATAEVQRLQMEESEAAAQVSSEQARWRKSISGSKNWIARSRAVEDDDCGDADAAGSMSGAILDQREGRIRSAERVEAQPSFLAH
jgi:hypothetical protein